MVIINRVPLSHSQQEVIYCAISHILKTVAVIKTNCDQCVVNSIPAVDKPFSFWKSDWTWLYSQEGGQCMAGYQAERGKSECCVSCPVERYKSKPGKGECNICCTSRKAVVWTAISTSITTAGCTWPPGSDFTTPAAAC